MTYSNSIFSPFYNFFILPNIIILLQIRNLKLHIIYLFYKKTTFFKVTLKLLIIILIFLFTPAS
jgi:hypothetical protein